MTLQEWYNNKQLTDPDNAGLIRRHPNWVPADELPIDIDLFLKEAETRRGFKDMPIYKDVIEFMKLSKKQIK